MCYDIENLNMCVSPHLPVEYGPVMLYDTGTKYSIFFRSQFFELLVFHEQYTAMPGVLQMKDHWIKVCKLQAGQA